MEPLIYALRLDEPLSREAAEILTAAADGEAVRKFRLYPDAVHARMSLVGSALSRIVASRVLNTMAAELQILRSDTGKPYVVGGKIFISVSHSDNLCVCAVCDREIGIDIERIRNDFPSRVAQRFFSPKENDEISSARAEERAEAFFRIWTRHESYVKCTGRGVGDIGREIPDGFEVESARVFDEYILSTCIFTDSSQKSND